jgi:hypothetical protein
LPTLGPKALTKLKVAFGQNEWLAEILGRFEEIALPDSWLVAGCIAQTIYRSRLARSQKIHWRATDKPSSIRSRVRS